MTNKTSPLLDEALEMLVDLAKCNTQPEDAWTAVHRLQDTHPDTPIDLAWERESFDHSMHYDLLLSIAEDATVSLSYCRDRGLPWPLRGVQRSSERSLLRVDSEVMTIDQAIAHLDFLWDERRLATRLIDACIIRAELQRRLLEPNPEEIDRALAAFRRTRGLLTPDATIAWMEQHGMTIERLRRFAADGLAATRLRTSATAGLVEPYFAAHHAKFDIVRAWEIIAPADTLQALITRLDKDSTDQILTVTQQFITANPRARATIDLRYAEYRRDQAPAACSAAFAANPGDLIGPLSSEQREICLLIVSTEPATLTGSVRSEIESRLFEEWLAERRSAATIEWYWGQATRTDITRSSI